MTNVYAILYKDTDEMYFDDIYTSFALALGAIVEDCENEFGNNFNLRIQRLDDNYSEYQIHAENDIIPFKYDYIIRKLPLI